MRKLPTPRRLYDMTKEERAVYNAVYYRTHAQRIKERVYRGRAARRAMDTAQIAMIRRPNTHA